MRPRSSPPLATESLHGKGIVVTRPRAAPTAITGFYGQNLPYPGFAHRSGFFMSSILIVALSGALYLTFKRKDWL